MNYFDIMSGDYPKFIDKYINTKEMQRLGGIGYFCGADYTRLQNIKKWYSRLDHSKTVALMAYHFTHDKVQTLATLFHDLGTPCYSHAIDYLLKDAEKQESSEKNVYDIISQSQEICYLLKQDKIDVTLFKDITKYSVIENERPKLCTDRLDSILKACELWIRMWSLEDIKEIYNDLTILTNEYKEVEIGFKTIKIAEKFFDGVYEVSIAMQRNEDKYAMQYMADILEYAIKNNYLNFNDLYSLSEQEINKILFNKTESYKVFNNITSIIRTDNKPSKYCVSVNVKQRYVDPVVNSLDGVKRLSQVSTKALKKLNKYLAFRDKKYCYSKDIVEIK